MFLRNPHAIFDFIRRSEGSFTEASEPTLAGIIEIEDPNLNEEEKLGRWILEGPPVDREAPAVTRAIVRDTITLVEVRWAIQTLTHINRLAGMVFTYFTHRRQGRRR